MARQDPGKRGRGPQDKGSRGGRQSVDRSSGAKLDGVSAGSDRPGRAGGKPRGGGRRPAPKPGLDTLYGVHAATAAIDNPGRTIRHIWATPNAAKRLTLPPALNDLLDIVAASELDARVPAGAVHQGLVVLAEPLPEPDVSDVAALHRVAVLDQITDPHNLGAILRSAAAFGIEAVIVTERHTPAVTGLIAKIASGGLERVPLIRATNLARAIETIQGYGFFCVGLAGETDTDVADAIKDARRLALVLGAEGQGLRRLTRERCDTLARIPMVGANTDDQDGAIDSINVSNAAAIAFYLASRTAED